MRKIAPKTPIVSFREPRGSTTTSRTPSPVMASTLPDTGDGAATDHGGNRGYPFPYDRAGSARGPVALLVFKTSVLAPRGAAGGFDPHTLPPTPPTNLESAEARRSAMLWAFFMHAVRA